MGKERDVKKWGAGVTGWGPDLGKPHASCQGVSVHPVVNREPLKGFNQEQT